MEPGPTKLGWKLLLAARSSQDENVNRLLVRGADPNFTTTSWETPLDAACKSKSFACIDLLLKAGASPVGMNDRGVSSLIFLLDGFYDPRCVELLAEAGADLNFTDSEGWAPLHVIAHQKGKTDIGPVVGSLVSLKADVNLGIEERHKYAGFTPLFFAARVPNYDVVQVLLANGADPNLIALNGHTALDEAGSEEAYQMIADASTRETVIASRPLDLTWKHFCCCGVASKLRCTRCHAPYCSKECQTGDWKAHKGLCKPL